MDKGMAKSKVNTKPIVKREKIKDKPISLRAGRMTPEEKIFKVLNIAICMREDMFIINSGIGYLTIVKRSKKNIIETLNPNGFQPLEKSSNIDLCCIHVLTWCDTYDEDFKEGFIRDLINLGNSSHRITDVLEIHDLLEKI